ncbi:MAG: hypothetical protein WCG50_18400, partial [Rhodoferax sp.]|uniref:hypothetical protein n=1 Tax=Rhodoferax sp. TaxID=50421 RepID=UPI003017AE88
VSGNITTCWWQYYYTSRQRGSNFIDFQSPILGSSHTQGRIQFLFVAVGTAAVAAVHEQHEN